MKCEVLRPSSLAAPERGAWTEMMQETPHLQRGFFSLGFALACEEAHGNAYVGVLHNNGTICGFLPFQFASFWHARGRLAERIGGAMSDNAGLIARSGTFVDPTALVQSCGLAILFLTHLAEGQEEFGLTASDWEIGHRIDLSGGSDAYFAAIRSDRKGFVQDTERRLRRAARDYGALSFTSSVRPGRQSVAQVIEEKRRQYRRTDVADPFANPRHQRLIEVLVEMAPEDCEPILTTLTADKRILARHLGLRHGNVLNYWFPVYDPEVQKISPGRLLLWNTILEADTLGIRMIDRGEGDSEAKRDFSTGTTRFGQANYVARSLRAAVAKLWQTAEWRWAHTKVRA